MKRRLGDAAATDETVRRAVAEMDRLEMATRSADPATKEAVARLRAALGSAIVEETVQKLTALIEAVLAGDAGRTQVAEIEVADAVLREVHTRQQLWAVEFAAVTKTAHTGGPEAADPNAVSQSGALAADAERWLRSH